jgi:LysR family glycine cleavage system transcriptional activator
LVPAGHTVVAAPGHIPRDRVETLEDLSAAHWLLLGAREEEHLWLRDHGLKQDDLRITFFDTGSLVIQAVRAGSGISVQPKAIVARDIEMGVLVSLYEEDPGDLAYYIVTRPNLVSDRLRIFIRWLKAQP